MSTKRDIDDLAHVDSQKGAYVEEKQHQLSPLLPLDDDVPEVEHDEELKCTIDNHVDPKKG